MKYERRNVEGTDFYQPIKRYEAMDRTQAVLLVILATVFIGSIFILGHMVKLGLIDGTLIF